MDIERRLFCEASTWVGTNIGDRMSGSVEYCWDWQWGYFVG